MSSGSTECPCIETFSTLLNISNCETAEGPGFWSYGLYNNQKQGSCFPLTYGERACHTHDLDHDPLCLGDDPPAYCYDQWCFVDMEECRSTNQLLFLSANQFLAQHEVYYSYSTCNSTSENWDAFSTTSSLAGKSLTVTFPTAEFPFHYKYKANGEVAARDDPEYYDDSLEWHGWMVEYLEAVKDISNIDSFQYTSRSGGSAVAVPSSAFTASVYDVESGLSHLGASIFWITAERLQMTPYTIPIAIETLTLWVPDPGIKEDSFVQSARNLFLPFTRELFFILFFTVIVTSVLNVWFERPKGDRKWLNKMRGKKWKNTSTRKRMYITWRAYLDESLGNTIGFFGASAEFDRHDSLATKILMAGFGMLVMITLVGYTANLTAFLTISAVGDFVKNMQEAGEAKTPICVQTLLAEQVAAQHPDAVWVFGDSYDDMFAHYDAGTCRGLALDVTMVIHRAMKEICARGLVDTGSIVVEEPLAFPIRTEISAGFSYWMRVAETKGITYASTEARERPALACGLTIDADEGIDDMGRLTPLDYVLPFTIFFFCCVTAIVVHLSSERRVLESFVEGNQENDLELTEERRFSVSSLEPPSHRFSVTSVDTLEGPNCRTEDVVDRLLKVQKIQNSLVQKLVKRKRLEDESGDLGPLYEY